MGYNQNSYNTPAVYNDPLFTTEKLTQYNVGEDFTADFPLKLTGVVPAGVEFNITVDESVDLNEKYGYELGAAERDTIIIGNAEID